MGGARGSTKGGEPWKRTWRERLINEIYENDLCVQVIGEKKKKTLLRGPPATKKREKGLTTEWGRDSDRVLSYHIERDMHQNNLEEK